jgi:endogenous inhibitor of DNA gyrase (YacG/DUF329 family)
MVVNCPKCGKEISGADIEVNKAYCSSCKEWFLIRGDTTENSSKKMTNEDTNKNSYMSAYVGKKYDIYYKEIFERKPQNKIYISFNWVPIFLGPIWLIYRKMYIEAIISIATSSIMDFILSSLIGFSDRLGEISGRLLGIILALIGNSIYRLKVYRVIKRIENINNEDHILYLKKHGGTNIIAAIIVFVIFLVLALLPIIFDI